MFLRHKLQKGLLTKEQQPKAEEMKQMSDYIGKLEAYTELEGGIIKSTKINKVLKAILKLNAIPKEEEFSFKSRSQTLLDKWNKVLSSEQGTPAAVVNGASTGVEAGSEDVKASSKELPNGSVDAEKSEKNGLGAEAEQSGPSDVKEPEADLEDSTAASEIKPVKVKIP